jgi:hypothetical protein
MEGASAAGAKVLGPHSASVEQDSENLKAGDGARVVDKTRAFRCALPYQT